MCVCVCGGGGGGAHLQRRGVGRPPPPRRRQHSIHTHTHTHTHTTFNINNRKVLQPKHRGVRVAHAALPLPTPRPKHFQPQLVGLPTGGPLLGRSIPEGRYNLVYTEIRWAPFGPLFPFLQSARGPCGPERAHTFGSALISSGPPPTSSISPFINTLSGSGTW
jgi:hypothetical protein